MRAHADGGRARHVSVRRAHAGVPRADRRGSSARAATRSRSCPTRAPAPTRWRWGIDWRPGDEVLLCDNEFPANAVPWLALRQRGVRVRLHRRARDERLTPDVLRRELTPRTRAVAVSWVSYADGYRHDLAGAGRGRARRRRAALRRRDSGLGRASRSTCARRGSTRCTRGAGKWMLGLHGVRAALRSRRI